MALNSFKIIIVSCDSKVTKLFLTDTLQKRITSFNYECLLVGIVSIHTRFWPNDKWSINNNANNWTPENSWIVLLSILFLLLLRITSLPYSEQLILLLSIANFLKKIGQVAIIRRSRSQMFFKIGVLKTFAIFTGKRLCSSLQAQLY